MVTYSACPGCGSALIAACLTVKDHAVSQETFEIWECSACTLRFTQAIPDQQAIGPYYHSEDYISHTDSKKGLVNNLYHLVRKKTLRHKLRLVQQYTGLTKGRILDIGAGTGAFLHTMQQAGWQGRGLEPEATARKVACDNYQLSLEDPEKLFLMEPDSFDAITLWHVLEHVHDLHRYLEQIRKILKSGGKLFIAVPNYTSCDAGVYGENWAAYDVPRHLYHFSPASMKTLLGRYALTVKDMKPMWYDSFYVSMLSERYRTAGAGLPAAIWNGLLSDIQTVFRKNKCSSLIYIGE